MVGSGVADRAGRAPSRRPRARRSEGRLRRTMHGPLPWLSLLLAGVALAATFMAARAPNLDAAPIAGCPLYGATGGSVSSSLLELDPANGTVVRTIGPIGYAITALALDPVTGVLYGSTSNYGPRGLTTPAPAEAKNLVRINATTGAGTLIGSHSIGPIADMAFNAAGTLYGWSEGPNNLDKLVTINTTTGAATVVNAAAPTLSSRGDGMAFNATGTLYFMPEGANGALRTVDVSTGNSTVVATLSSAPLPSSPIKSAAFDPSGTLYAVNGGGNNSPTAPVPHLVTVNTTRRGR